MAKLQRELHLWDGVALVVGITMGVGIFAVPGRVAAYLPSVQMVALAWLIAAAAAVLGGMLYAELGSRLPNTGGEYVYLLKAFGPGVAFVYGWTQLLVIRTNPAAALSLVAAEYVEYFLPLVEWQRLTIAVSLITALGLANYLGLRAGKRVQMATTVFKVAGALIFITAGALAVQNYSNLASTHLPPQTLGPLGNFTSALTLTIFAYVGFDRLGFLAGEMHDPVKNVPRALAIGIVTLVVLYLSMNLYYHALIPIGQISETRVIATDAAVRSMRSAGAALIALTVIVSAAGSTNGTIMSCSRIYYAMARDGLFLRQLAYVHPRYHSPAAAIAAHCLWATVLLLVGRELEVLVGSLVFMVLIWYALMIAALFRLRARHEGENNGPVYRMAGYPYTPIAYLLLIVVMTVTACVYHPVSALMNTLLVLSGAPVYFAWKRNSS